MSTLRERLAIALAKKRNGSKRGLQLACGVSQPSVSDWFSGETKTMKADSLIKASRYLGVRLEWLESGVGPMSDSHEVVHEVREPERPWFDWPFRQISPQRWQQLPPEMRAQIEGFALGLLMSIPDSPPPRKDGTTGQPSF